MAWFNAYILNCFARPGLMLITGLLVCGIGGTGVQAQTIPTRDWTVLGQEVIEQRARVQRLSEQEQALLDEIDRVGFTLEVHKRELDRIKAEADNIEKDLQALTKKIAGLEKAAVASKTDARQSMINLYKARMLGNLGSLATADSLLELSLRQKLFNGMLQKEYETTQFLNLTLVELSAAQTEMMDMRAYENKKMAESRAKLQEVNAVRAENEKLLKNIAKEKDLQLAALKYMEASSQELDNQMLKLNAAITFTTPTGDEKKPLGGSFSASKGLLIMPVKGTITTKFGPYKPPGETVELFRKGIDIKAAPQATVSAVFAGTVVYADWFKGYGNMLILDHGEGYFSVYARLGKMYKASNSVVLAGEALGEINHDRGISGSELYFEIRHHAQPLNPAVWLTKNR